MKNSSIGTKLLLGAVTAAVVAYFVMQGVGFFRSPLSTVLAYAYEVEEGTDLSGFVVRDEQVMPPEGNGLLKMQRAEGERVGRGGIVAAVYPDQASLDRQTEISEAAARLEQLQYAQQAAVGADVSLKLDNQILQSLLAFRADVTASKLYDAESHEEELRTLVIKRDYTYSNSADLSAQIETLKGELKHMRAQPHSPIRRLKAITAGLYSAVVDGYEEVLTPGWVREMTPDKLRSAEPDPNVFSNVGKIIRGDEWYFAAVVDEDQAGDYEEGQRMTLRFAKNVEQDLSVRVQSVSRPQDGEAAVVFRGRTHLQELTLLRQQSAKVITRNVSGLRIPTEALRGEKVTVDRKTGERTSTPETGVYCVMGAEALFKPVKVVYSGDDFLLVRSALEYVEGEISKKEDLLRLRPGDEIILSGTDLYDGAIIH